MLIDADHVIAENDKHLRASRWAMENITLANHAIDLLRAVSYLALDTADDITMLRLGVRLINTAGAGGTAALSGYYQQAAGHIRDLIEVGFLLDLLRREPKEINRWRVIDDKSRRKIFSAFALRQRLNRLDGATEDKRDEAYQLFSAHGTHVAPNTIALISPGGDTIIGPFPDRDRVVALSFELARYLAGGVVYLAAWVNTRSVLDDNNTKAYLAAHAAFVEYYSRFAKRTTPHDE